MAAIIIDADRSWRIDTNPIDDPRQLLSTHLGPLPQVESIALLSDLRLWVGATGDPNALASGLLTYLGWAQFVLGPAVITAVAAQSICGLTSRHIRGLMALLQIVAADKALLAQQEQASQSWATWFPRAARS